MKYDFDHWDKTEMTQEEALAWFESEFEVTDGKRCSPTCPQCQAEEWAIKALKTMNDSTNKREAIAEYIYTVSDVDPGDKWTVCRWLPYPFFKPTKEGRYLVCTPSICYPRTPTIDIVIWGKSEECEWRDKSLKKKKAYWYDTDLEWGDHTVDDVYAWMPLPEPMPREEETDVYTPDKS